MLLTLPHSISQKLRKRIEEIFDLEQDDVAACNLVRAAKLMVASPPAPARV